MLIQGKYRCINCFKELNDEHAICSCGFDESTYEVMPHIIAPGTIINGMYCIGRVLGQGGFGITYSAYDLNLEMRIAIKEFFMSGFNSRTNTLSNEVSSTYGDAQATFETQKSKFINEARTLAKFNNDDGIVTVHTFFKANNTAYIVMEFLDGQTLKEYLDDHGTLSVDEVMKMFIPIIDNLGKVHETNLMHRDISPDNIIYTKNGKIKLLDFGAARSNSDGNKSLSVVLKHGYAPMEQYQTHGKQGPWTDVYALSATIYKCLTGVTPISAADRIMSDDLSPISQLVPGCPQSINDVIMKGLSVHIEDRYQTMNELEKALKDAYATKAATVTPPVNNIQSTNVPPTTATPVVNNVQTNNIQPNTATPPVNRVQTNNIQPNAATPPVNNVQTNNIQPNAATPPVNNVRTNNIQPAVVTGNVPPMVAQGQNYPQQGIYYATAPQGSPVVSAPVGAMQPQQYNMVPPQRNVVYHSAPVPPKKNKGRVIGIIIACIAALFVITVAIGILSDNNTSDSDNDIPRGKVTRETSTDSDTDNDRALVVDDVDDDSIEEVDVSDDALPATSDTEVAAPDTDSSTDEISLGHNDGAKYENDYFQIGCVLGSEWTLENEEQILARNQLAKSLVDDKFAAAFDNTSNITDMVAVHSNGMDTVNAGIEKLKGAAALIDEQQYIDITVPQLDEMFASMGLENIKTVAGEMTFAGSKHKCIDVTASFNGVNVYEKLVVVKKNDYMFCVTACTWNSNGVDNLLSKFYSF